MKRKELVIVNVMMMSVVLFFSILTVNLSANQSLWSALKQTLAGGSGGTAQTDKVATCSTHKELTVPNTTDPQLKKLQEYQAICHSYVTNTLMFFTSFPSNDQDAKAYATTTANKLKAYNAAGVQPIVIIEPYVGDALMPYRKFLNGVYDKPLAVFFENLKNAGITDQMMGTWVPFPESNTPNWDNKDTEPSDFAHAVNRYLASMKMQFPTAKGSVLLNSATYEPTDSQWENGNYLDLAPYLQDLDKTMVTSIGIQGFPWISDATTKRREIFRASEFLQPDLAISAAQELHTKDIWFNTGSFATKYAQSDKQRMHLTVNERQAILDGALDEVSRVQQYQQNQYRVSINLFAEDKSAAGEATDWSYFQDGDNQEVLKNFLSRAESLNIPVSLYDAIHPKK